ncbi:MAG: sulfatase-like hydrolase/transferase [Negativicutes bacterium]|nr:sulfatase-like hydrolase/transferase [Negativicutes bacterium]
MSAWARFFKNIQQDFKLFIFTLFVLCLYRVAFIGLLHQYLGDTTALSDILMSLFYGLRLSLKSAGIIALLTFLCCTITNLFIKSKEVEKVRYYLGSIYTILLTLLFHTRIPYYEEFHSAFDQIIFNTFKDDTIALFDTLVKQYQLPLRLFSVAVISFILCRLLKVFLATKTCPSPKFSSKPRRLVFRTTVILMIATFMVFTRFAGSFSYARAIHWENSALTKDAFLNEAILDDVQALYRAYAGYERLRNAEGLDIKADKVAEYGRQLANRSIMTNNIDDYFKKEAQGPKIQKPRHIFVIIGEAYAEWPLLPKYKDLNIANGLKNIAAKENAVTVKAFLPTGPNTAQAVNGIVTGLAEVNLYPNYHPETYKQPYATAIAAQMKKLGYKTYFWYGGFSSWQKIKELALSQGFDEFYGCNDLQDNSGNAWGMEDKFFLKEIAAKTTDDQPSFHVILTTSNHPPYTVNLVQEGFDEETVNSVPEYFKETKDWQQKLGHFWYADKILADFVSTMQKKYPDSLFAITGDHANRVNIEPNPSLYERYAVPFILYGKGVNKSIIPDNAAGTHLGIAPTLFELIAPKSFEYYSISDSLTKGNTIGTNHELWITANNIGKTGTPTIETLPNANSKKSSPTIEIIKQYSDSIQALSWWRIKNGRNI